MRLPRLIAALALLAAACGDSPDRDRPPTDADPEERFASYARDVFAELRQQPLDTTLGTEIGLFGDLSVGMQESVVMRQYRYQVDSTSFGPVARMVFQIRDTTAPEDPLPVILTFASRDEVWHLEQAEFGYALGDSAATPDAGRFPADDELAESPESRSPLYNSLSTRLHPWLDRALSRVDSVGIN